MEFLKTLIAEGFTLFLIEHDMNVVMGISDWVTVMDMASRSLKDSPPTSTKTRASSRLI